MEYTIRKNVLPSYFQVGTGYMKNCVSVGEISTLPTETITALHYHRCLEIGICCTGTGETHIENRIYHFSPGDIQYVGANIPHMSKAAPGLLCTWVWIFIDAMQLFTNDESRLVSTMLNISGNGFNGVFHPDEYPQLTALVQRLRSKKDNEDKFNSLENMFLSGQILIESARIENSDKHEKLLISSRIKPALQYIQNNYMNPQKMSADIIASICNLSTSHFRALFKEDIGMTLPQFIKKTRLSAVVYQLQLTDESVNSIAKNCGYYEISHFNRIFKSEFGITPIQMRKKLSER